MTAPTGREHRTPVTITTTSATERAVFRTCRRQWLLAIVHRLGSLEKNQNFVLGTAIHDGLAVYYRGVQAGPRTAISLAQLELEALSQYSENIGEATRETQEALGWLWPTYEQSWKDLVDLGAGMLAGYFVNERANPIGTPLMVEERHIIPIKVRGRKIGALSVQLDLLVKRSDGLKAVVDHKTASRDHNPGQLDLNDQLTAYAWACREVIEEHVSIAMFNLLYKKVPGAPRLLKNGTLSKDKSAPVTLGTYVAAIEEHGLNRGDYLDHLEWLRYGDDRPKFFERDGSFRSVAQLDEFGDNLVHEWRDMARVAKNPDLAYPNPSAFNCPSCPVRSICASMLAQEDTETVIRDNYEVLPPRR